MDSRRIIFTNSSKQFFSTVRKASGLSWVQLATSASINVRTLSSWRTKENTMPALLAKAWSERFHITIPPHEIIDLNEKRIKAASLGGFARLAQYGDLGTPEGRRRGGLRAWQTHKQNPTSPFVARSVVRPKKNVRFAELIGAILGDGSLTKYQLILYSNAISDREYSAFLSKLIIEIFGITPTVTHHVSRGVTTVTCSSKNTVNYLLSIGLGLGNKTKRQAAVPVWILKNRAYINACMRGLIDTDGCVYLDRHTIKGHRYTSHCIAFTNASHPLLDFVFNAWRALGFHPTRHGRDVRLRRSEEVIQHAKEIGFSNPKHSRKIKVQ